MIATSNCPLVGWMSGSWTQNWARFGWRPLRHFGGSLRLKASMIRCRRAVPLLIYTLAFALQLRRSTENLSQGRCQRSPRCIVYIPHLLWPSVRSQVPTSASSLFPIGAPPDSLRLVRCIPSEPKAFHFISKDEVLLFLNINFVHVLYLIRSWDCSAV
jgi:hypothetical protein